MKNDNKLTWLIILSVVFMLTFYLKTKNKVVKEEIVVENIEEAPEIPEEVKEEPKEEIEEIKEEKHEEPKWTEWKKLRDVNHLGRVLGDIESHMPAGHSFVANDKVTWAHETTHGINNEIRNSIGGNVNAFYVLNDKAAVIQEPKTTIQRVASKVPNILKGFSFDLYLIKQRGDWNNQPLYLMDEWTAYINGAECAIEINGDSLMSELISSHNFNVYCLYLAQCIKEDCPDYDDTQFKAYLRWGIERTFQLTKQKMNTSYKMDTKIVVKEHLFFIREKHLYGRSDKEFFLTMADLDVGSYINTIRTNPQAEGLRTFAREYLGEDWCKEVYGF